MERISLEELFRRAVDVVEGLGEPYCVFGGWATSVWGTAVPTEDVDLLVGVRDPARLLAALRRGDFALPENADDLFPIDKMVVATAGGREVDLMWGTNDFDREALRRAVRRTILDREARVATAEDLILYKLVAYRPKDLAHIESVLRRQGPALDRAYLRRAARTIAESTGRFELPTELDRILAS